MGRNFIYTSSWHEGDVVEITTNSTIEQITPIVPRVHIVVGKDVHVDFNVGFTFADGTVIEIKEGGCLEVTSNVTIGKNCRIYAGSEALSLLEKKSLTIGQNSVLHLQRHSVIGSGTLVGDFAQIEAPLVEIFGSKVKVEGDWLNDRVYPQWFGAVAYKSCGEASAASSVCSADAIERAVRMAVYGEVFIPRGYYRIARTIKLPFGVNIRGASSVEWDYDGVTKYGTVLVSAFDYEGLKSRLQGVDDNCESCKENNYLIEINVQWVVIVENPEDDAEKWKKIIVPRSEIEYTTRETSIKNLRLRNSSLPLLKDIGREQAYLMYGILSGASLNMDGVTFQHFGQALRFTDNYIDNKCVVNCTMSEYWDAYMLNQDEAHKPYAFNMGFLGDALMFAHNGVSGFVNKGLLVNNCGGAMICDNIITAESKIRQSKAVDFSSNHLERGTILKIEDSEVTMRSNYFWLGQEPVVQISGADGSVVSMDGDAFRFYDSAFYMSQSDFEKTKDDNGAAYRINADIALDRQSKLNLSNVYRYWGGEGFSSMLTCGVHVCEWMDDGSFGEVLDVFKRFSYALSRNCQISTGFKANMHFEEVGLMNVPDPRPYGMLNAGVAWVLMYDTGKTDVKGNKIYEKDVGTYTYECQLLLDSKRGIGWTYDDKLMMRNLPIWDGEGFVGSVEFDYRKDADGKPEKDKPIAGFLLVLPNVYGVVRIKRMKSTGADCRYVDVPVCGAKFLYDNGVSVCGFPWQDYTHNDEITLNKGVDSVEISASRAKLYANQSVFKNLKSEDVVYKLGDKYTLIDNNK
ncbi:MAG: hypothetical protein ACLVJI_02745 [Bacilli bacterium]|uniref:hypothetical protein n=2 Tax=Candidatus Limisoma sp. TaxID=3076476 RepID=UPI003A34615F